MLYYLFDFLDKQFNIPGSGMFQYTSFRAGMAVLTALLIALFFGKKIINYLRREQLGETVRDLGLVGEKEKQGTPTMGGVIIILATIIPVLLFAKLNNIYIIILLVSTVWLGAIGFIDDYIKVFRKNKEGLKGKFKVLGQVGLGLFVGAMIYFSPDVTVKHQVPVEQGKVIGNQIIKFGQEEKSLDTTVPFLKNNEFNYGKLLFWMDESGKLKYEWIVYLLAVIFIITAVSNGANLTDGIDGLAAGSSVIIVAALALFAFVSGNIIFADYLNIVFIPRTEEVVIFCTAFIGGLIGFLWYNTYPAQVFMGDTGSLTIGGLIAVIAIIVRKELMLPVLCGIFFAESLSVMLQVSYFKYTKKKSGEGRRIFLMSPLHHHYQKEGYHESKIVNRMVIIGFILAVACVITLKMR
ncbi:phospho-N-acetylmuramoyl-pentapeptide-transferase [Moheibacter sediminis]|uniref:Phospho-N-acetylmuramoyl-pentapeptide-transferase n=1 Tax=Moheibacter sediminis TaxID=1434700 RepID=A0A1W2CRF2_9FLAO|nr:phospho-N-acetylmuramoyl-pentapeptide-transferase [Moheibacter sediminis]SMC87810.1 Phospho-N-acetylmuramoyl-pentapeptide-transferase [Moheibacter sediminis]